MTKDFVAIGAGMLVLGVEISGWWGAPAAARPAETQESPSADDPA